MAKKIELYMGTKKDKLYRKIATGTHEEMEKESNKQGKAGNYDGSIFIEAGYVPTNVKEFSENELDKYLIKSHTKK